VDRRAGAAGCGPDRQRADARLLRLAMALVGALALVRLLVYACGARCSAWR